MEVKNFTHESEDEQEKYLALLIPTPPGIHERQQTPAIYCFPEMEIDFEEPEPVELPPEIPEAEQIENLLNKLKMLKEEEGEVTSCEVGV